MNIHIKHISIVLVLLMVSCEQENNNTVSKNILDDWHVFKLTQTISIETNVSVTINNPFVEGNGSILVSGAQETELKYIYLYSANGVTNVHISNNNLGIDLNYVLNIYDYGSLGSYAQFSVIDIDALRVYEGDLNFTIDETVVMVHSGALYNENQTDSVLITGNLSPVQMTIPGVTETELGTAEWLFNQYEKTLSISKDNHFVETIIYSNGDSVETNGVWEGNAEELTLHYDTYSATYAYAFNEHTLILSLRTDMCASSMEDCLSVYELIFGLESGTLKAVTQMESTYFSK